VAKEITSICANFVVELMGFEPMAIAGAARSRAIPLFASKCAQAVRGTRLLDHDRRPRLGSSLFCLRPPPRRGRIAIRWIEVDAAATQPTPEDGAGFVVVAPGWVRTDIGGPKGAEVNDQGERKPVPQSQGPRLSDLAQEFPADRVALDPVNVRS
jgi:hypothetical protein